MQCELEAKLWSHLEGHLGTLEVTEAATVGGETTAATTATTTSATASTVAKATASAATAATTATATTEAATASTVTAAATVVVTSSSKVDADVASVNVLAAQAVKSSLGLLDSAKLDVSETLRGTGVAVSGQRDTGDLAVLAEGLANALVGGVEGKVANEEGVAGRTALVTELLGASSTLVLVLLARLAEVDVQGTTIKVGVVKSLLGGLCSVGGGELNVTETAVALANVRPKLFEYKQNVPLGAARLAVSDDAAALNRSVRSEGRRKPLLIDVPAEVANEEVLDALFTRRLGLALLHDGLGLSLSLALLGRSFLLVTIAGVVGVIGVGVRIGVGGVIRVRGGLWSCQ